MSRFATSSSAYGAFYAAGFQSLPPRHRVAEAQEVLLQVLATPRGRGASTTEPEQGDLLMQAKARQQARTGAQRCDRCDGPHPTHLCPHFRKERDGHEDAQIHRPVPNCSDESIAPDTVFARVVRQPGDGACLFHSLAHHVGGNGQALRREVADRIEASPNLEVAGTPLHKWVAWDSGGLAPPAYASKLRSGAWGGALEMAVIAATFSVCIHVYEQQPGSSPAFKRMASFRPPGGEPVASAHVVYRGRVHYDALDVDAT